MNSVSASVSLDALIVGAGFGGAYQLKRLREEGYNVKLIETADTWGGVWYWNRYPGARVDSTTPHYEFSDPKLWTEWRWAQRFPGSQELRDYFQFVAKKWDLNRDAIFNTSATAATWHEASGTWHVQTNGDQSFVARYLLLNTGISAKRYVPDWPGIDTFSGTFIHPSYWPAEEPNLEGKNVAVIGTGATGVQLAQALSQKAKNFYLFQRTPNTAIPMKQVNYSGDEQALPKNAYHDLFAARSASFSGLSFNFLPKGTFEDTPEQRKQVYEELWAQGDFRFWVGTYYDMLSNEEANKEAYNFWKSKVRRRINDPRLQEILAPEIQPHSFGCKRISLENGYFEIFNQPNVTLVDMKSTPIVEVTESGIKTTGGEVKLDYIVCATGYDAVTGGLKNIDIRGVDGQKLTEKWAKGTKTYLGMSVSGFPNMFFTYGPQAPTAFCNGPTCAELQGEWIVKLMKEMTSSDKSKIEALPDVEQQRQWYMGDNIPGKPREPLIYLGGVPNYYKAISDVAADGYRGFERR
ncbi:FAD/NAD(P)-binding domain-containing protein [Clathrospora elynae]|uniref:FAD/NAD(P)-binding domain-containing protein n=1 Tax=Clathrospora elynae TaxID=706981 RepID=A0A6A5T2T2_9PLEO|nr:FAD/NAD(P)-binding domain-containing protein [Clathrospora elynae]